LAKASGLVGPDGKPIESSKFKKEAPPKTGPAYGQWGGEPLSNFLRGIPGASVTQFDLTQLTLQDFRNMRAHPSVNTALSVLSFMQHQSEWKIDHPDKKVRDMCTEQLTNVWTQLNRSMAQANWAGYSPTALEWENDVDGAAVTLTKVKDLIPENCVVNWKEIEGYAPPGELKPKFHIYDGIKQIGQPRPIPKENTFWYPMMMENGNYYGRRLLEAAFTPWYFSMLMHIYANRYYERFGEPTPIGRAPFEEDQPAGSVPAGEVVMKGNQYLLKTMQDLRNRSVVVLPNDGHQDSSTGKFLYDYDINFLESQMRGADFERYMTRLDEEISLALFTPTLLFRVADVGSYDLGKGHMQVYLWMMNHLNADRAEYINRYILSPIVDYNVSSKAPRAKIIFKKLGATNADLVQSMIVAMLNSGTVKPDLVALGEMAGMTLTAVKQTLAPTDGTPAAGAGSDTKDTGNATGDATKPPKATTKAGKDRDGVVFSMLERIIPQVHRYKSTGLWKDLDFGFSGSLAEVLRIQGSAAPREDAQVILDTMREFCSWQDFSTLDSTETIQVISEKLESVIPA
jgi:hypothetical protein